MKHSRIKKGYNVRVKYQSINDYSMTESIFVGGKTLQGRERQKYNRKHLVIVKHCVDVN